MMKQFKLRLNHIDPEMVEMYEDGPRPNMVTAFHVDNFLFEETEGKSIYNALRDNSAVIVKMEVVEDDN